MGCMMHIVLRGYWAWVVKLSEKGGDPQELEAWLVAAVVELWFAYLRYDAMMWDIFICLVDEINIKRMLLDHKLEDLVML